MKYKVGDDIIVKSSGYKGKVLRVKDDNGYMEDYRWNNTGNTYLVNDGQWYTDGQIKLCVRGFQVIPGYEDIPLPTRATTGSAGYDITCAKDTVIPPGEISMIPTGLSAYMKPNEWLGIYIRSSIGAMGLTMANNVAVIDSDFNDHFHIILKNITDKPILINAGKKIAQGIFQEFLVTDDDNVTRVRNGGVGSTGV